MDDKEDIDRLENEGGLVLLPCVECTKMVVPYKDGLCVFCWLKKRNAEDPNYT